MLVVVVVIASVVVADSVVVDDVVVIVVVVVVELLVVVVLDVDVVVVVVAHGSGIVVLVVVVGGACCEFASYAPIEQLVAPVPGRTNPRWSRLSTGAVPVLVEQTLSSPALIAGLAPEHPTLGASVPVQTAIVCVVPPLLTSPPGSRRGFVLQNELPLLAVHVPFGVGNEPVQSAFVTQARPG